MTIETLVSLYYITQENYELDEVEDHAICPLILYFKPILAVSFI